MRRVLIQNLSTGDKLSMLIALVVLVSWIFVVFDRDDAEVTPAQTGCYKGTSSFADVELRVGSNGYLVSDGTKVGIYLTHYRDQLAIEPKRKVLLNVNRHVISTSPGGVELIRLNADGSLYMPTDKDFDVLFVRCK